VKHSDGYYLTYDMLNLVAKQPREDMKLIETPIPDRKQLSLHQPKVQESFEGTCINPCAP